VSPAQYTLAGPVAEFCVEKMLRNIDGDSTAPII
jgi:hypothetical protein